MDSRRSMIDKLSARQISDPCRMYGEQSAVRFSEENTFYTISSASRGSSRQEARANDNIFNRESTVFGHDPWRVTDPALRRLCGWTRLGTHSQLPGGLRKRQHFVFPNGFRSTTWRLTRLSPNGKMDQRDHPAIESSFPVLPSIGSRSILPDFDTTNPGDDRVHKRQDNAKKDTRRAKNLPYSH